MTHVQRGPATILFRGRTIHRQHGFIELPFLICPDHHRIKRGGATIRSDGALTCTHRDRQGAPECGALMWMLNVPGGGYQQRFYVADVTLQELQFWEQQQYGAEDVLRYLGAWFSRVTDVNSPAALQRRVG